MSERAQLCSGREAVRKLIRVGSHVMLGKLGYPYTLSIPQHKELGIGLLRKIIKQAGLSVVEFNSL